MLELIDELRAHEFDVFIVTGGGAEFVRAISRTFYDVSPDAVVGSLVGYEFTRDADGRPRLLRTTELFGEVNEGAPKVTNIQLQLGRRPIFAAGNSPGDAEMLEYALAAGTPSMALVVSHDDAEREYAYEGRAGSFETDGSFDDTARGLGITVVSMRSDWVTVFWKTTTAPCPTTRRAGRRHDDHDVVVVERQPMILAFAAAYSASSILPPSGDRRAWRAGRHRSCRRCRTGGGPDVRLHLLVLLLGSGDLTLAHAATSRNEIDEDAQERQEDDEDRPDGLGRSTHVVAADDVSEDREDQHDPHEEQEEPKE